MVDVSPPSRVSCRGRFYLNISKNGLPFPVVYRRLFIWYHYPYVLHNLSLSPLRSVASSPGAVILAAGAYSSGDSVTLFHLILTRHRADAKTKYHLHIVDVAVAIWKWQIDRDIFCK